MGEGTYGYTRYYDTQAIIKYEMDELRNNRLETYVIVKERKVYIRKVLNGNVVSEDEIFSLG